MKTLMRNISVVQILAVLVASVAAEAEPSPGIASSLLYPYSGGIGYGLGSHLGDGLGSGLGYNFGSGLGYGLGSGVGYGHGYLGYPYAGHSLTKALSHTLHKRDASPEPSLTHAGLGLGGLYGGYGIGTGLGTGLGYGYGINSGLGYGYGIGTGLGSGLGYGYGIGAGLGSGLGYGYGVGHLPYHHLGKRDADPGFFPGVVGHGASYGYGSSVLHPGFGHSHVYNQGVVAPYYG